MPFIIVATISEPAPFALQNAPSYVADTNLWTQDLSAAKQFDRVDEAVRLLDSTVELGILEDVHILPLKPWIEQMQANPEAS